VKHVLGYDIQVERRQETFSIQVQRSSRFEKQKFKSFRQRKPDHALTREFKGLHDKQDAVASSEEMSSLIAKFSL
jgi:hypothetical protein